MSKKQTVLIKNLPSEGGVYIFKDRKGKVLYVGKSTNIKERVKNHLGISSHPRHELLVSRIYTVEYHVLFNQASSLLLEQALIKEFRPPFNVELRDDKSYPYIKISKEDFSCVSIVRMRKPTQDLYIGPFVNKKVLREALDLARRIFGFRTCKRMNRRGCLNWHLRLCPAPCMARISKKEYKRNIKRFIMMFEGQRDKLVKDLQADMDRASSRLDFEKAVLARDRLKSLVSLYKGMGGYIQEATLLKDLLMLKKVPRRIEAIDLSSLAGKFLTGSVVVFVDGEPDKTEYRRFKIKQTKARDDFSMLREVTFRRYKRLMEEKKKIPDLIIIDGGRAHLNEARKVLKGLNINTDVISIAKEEERIYTPYYAQPLQLPDNSWALHLIQRLRNEAHRFARKYHTLLRKKNFLDGKKKKK